MAPPAMKAAGEPGAAPGTGTLRTVERALREEARQEVDDYLAGQGIVAPRPEDREPIRALIEGRVAAYQRRAATTNAPYLPDPDGTVGRLFDDLYFDDDHALLQLVKRILGPLGRRLDESSPLVDARLPDGSRLNAAIPPATVRWCSVTIRKFLLRAHALEQLVELGTLTEAVAHFLDAAVQAGVNILVSGPTGSGKTTMLNALGASIASPEERVITVEEVAELQLE